MTCYTSGAHHDDTAAADASYAIAEIYNEMRRWTDAREYAERAHTLRTTLHNNMTNEMEQHRIKGDLCLAKCLLAATLGAPNVACYDDAERYAQEAMKMIKGEEKTFTQQCELKTQHGNDE